MMIDSHTNTIGKVHFWSRNKLKIMVQSETAECGLTCLAMIADYYGWHTDLVSIRREFKVSQGGATLQDLIRFSQTLNLTSRALRIELEDLDKLQTPCILHWNLNHFVVLKSVTKKHITIHDPAFGERKVSMKDASLSFTGVALELSPTSNFVKTDKIQKLKFSDFWTKITGLKKSLLQVVILSFILQAFILAGPYYLQLVVDDVILTGDTSLLVVLALGFFLVLLFEILTSSLRSLTLLHFGNLMHFQLGKNLFHHLIRLPMEFFEKRHMGDIVSRFSSLQQIRHLLTTGLTEAIIDGVMAVITLAMLFFYSPSLSAVVLIAVFLYAIVRYFSYHSFRSISEQEITAKAEENSNFMETIRGMQTIKLFSSETKREGMWQNYYANTVNQAIRIGNFQITFDAVNKLLFGIENVVVIYLAAKLVIAGGFSAGMLFAFIAYKQQFMSKTYNLIEKLIEFKMISLHFDRLADIVLTKKEELPATGTLDVPISGRLTLKNISFRYSDAAPNILSNLNIDIQAGESVAITGPSGCGKSTLIKIMLGLCSPQQGEVLVDNIPIDRLGQTNYRLQVAAVMQNDQLLSGSIGENIAFFDNDIDMEKVTECARLAALHNDICKMPMGYDTLIGDMGSSLSGGQKQRVLLARALYKEPKVLFMDEATSHLDTALEKDINNAIKSLNMTRVIIAHRKETIASAGREIVLNSIIPQEIS